MQRVSLYLTILKNCFSLNTLHSVHTHLIKLNLYNTNTILSNRCLALYSKFGTLNDTIHSFHDIRYKNVFSWNIYMRVFIRFRDVKTARQVFDEMPQRDVVSWNTMISGYLINGDEDGAVGMFEEMQGCGVRPSEYTYSIVLSLARAVLRGMEVHCSVMKRGMVYGSVIVGNSLIDVYCKYGFVDYGFSVFMDMEEVDVISWNSLIAGCSKLGYEDMAFEQFCVMRRTGYKPDAFTMSAVLTACASVQGLVKGEQVLCLSIKSGFLSNAIVSSAAINMFSKCERINDSVTVFKELDMWDSAVCNSMISSFTNHRLEENAMQIFTRSLRKNVRPDEFTLSCLISCVSVFLPLVYGIELHCLVVKLGFEHDPVVSSSLVEMYSKCGFFDAAKIIFDKMDLKDLISWNSMIFGSTYNGRIVDSINIFEDLRRTSLFPDAITLTGVLLACNHGRLIDEGLLIFNTMENIYGVKPTDSHVTAVVEMMLKAGKLNEAMNIITRMPFGLNAYMCELILSTYGVQGELRFTEQVAERLVELEPMSLLPYIVLGKAYEVRGRWESLARLKKVMKDRNIKKVIGCSWIGVNSSVFVYKENEVIHHGGEDVYSTLRLLMHDIEDEGYILQLYQKVDDERQNYRNSNTF